MIVSRNATPLISLDAIALDLETTGLDPHSRIVEIGAVRIAGGRFDPSARPLSSACAARRAHSGCGNPRPRY